MATNFNMIKTAHNLDLDTQKLHTTIRANINQTATANNTTPEALTESAMHVLANIAQTATSGAPIKAMHADSAAAFLAGIEAIAQALPTANDEQKKANTLRVLAQAGIGPDGLVNTAVAPIAQLGARKTDLIGKYKQIIQAYMTSVNSGKPMGDQLANIAKQLQMAIDKAMRSSTQPAARPPAAVPAR